MSRQDHSNTASLAATLAATVIDTLEFARQGRRIEGRIPVAAMERVAEVLDDRQGDVSVALQGSRDRDRKNWLSLSLEGDLAMTCQRCLGRISYPLRVESRLQLIGPGDDWPDEELADDEADAIPAAQDQAVLGLVEDEVLLALPIAPKHDKCGAPDEARRDRTVASPFAVLAGLKKH